MHEKVVSQKVNDFYSILFSVSLCGFSVNLCATVPKGFLWKISHTEKYGRTTEVHRGEKYFPDKILFKKQFTNYR
jgi:hypothetical protein